MRSRHLHIERGFHVVETGAAIVWALPVPNGPALNVSLVQQGGFRAFERVFRIVLEPS